MSEAQDKPGGRDNSSLISVAIFIALAVAAGIYFIEQPARKAGPISIENVPDAGISSTVKVTKDMATGALTAFVMKPNRPPVPDLTFNDAFGQAKSLSSWRGRVVLVNLWATWCAPCRKEMPSLSALQRQLGSKDFEVVAISLDRKGREAAAAFLAETGVTNLALYLDSSAAILDQLQAMGLPASVLVDRHGHEIGRMLGPADWSAPEAVALIKAAMAEG
jgi:thiol-disulfide isomerase/thioredoxin